MPWMVGGKGRQSVIVDTKGKGQSDFSDRPLFNAGNLRRVESVSARPLRAGAFCRNPERFCEGSPPPQLQKEKATNISVGSLLLMPATSCGL